MPGKHYPVKNTLPRTKQADPPSEAIPPTVLPDVGSFQGNADHFRL